MQQQYMYMGYILTTTKLVVQSPVDVNGVSNQSLDVDIRTEVKVVL